MMKVRKMTLKQRYEQNLETIQIALCIVIAIVLFITGYCFSFKGLLKPLNNEQFEACESIARDVYEQRHIKEGQIIVEVPEGYSVDISSTTISVKMTEDAIRGKVVASLQNGELVFERVPQNEMAVFASILIGMVFVLIPLLIVSIVCKIRLKFRS